MTAPQSLDQTNLAIIHYGFNFIFAATAGRRKKRCVCFAVFENCGFMKKLLLQVDLFSDLTALAVFSFDRTVEIMN